MTTGRELAGIRVLVTRPAAQADELCRGIEAYAGTAVRLPAMIIETVAAESDVLAGLSGADLAIFISPNAVVEGLQQVRRAYTDWPSGLSVAAVGRQTAKALQRAGLRADIFPHGAGNSEALLALPALRQLSAGQRVIIFRGVGGRDLLAQSLRARAVAVEYCQVYRRRPAPGLVGGLSHLAAEDALDVVTVTSNAVLEFLHSAAQEGGCEAWLRQRYLLVMGARAGALARHLGFHRLQLTDGTGVPGFVAALRKYSAEYISVRGGEYREQ